MAKKNSSKLTSKLRCILRLRRWNSSSSPSSSSPPTLTRTASGRSGSDPESAGDAGAWRQSGSFGGCDEVPAGYHPVYVGKSRRRYLIGSHLLDHPVFQNLLETSSPAVVGCEVVLFEHLLWMLENADPKPESLDELVEFYAC